MSTRLTAGLVALGTAALTAVALGAAPASADPYGGGSGGSKAPVVVVSGLNNPRQLSLVGNQLLIAEAGAGGSTCQGTGDDETCIGTTGAISSVYNPQWKHNTMPRRVVKGLLSGSGPTGEFAVGSDGVAGTYAGGPVLVQMTYAPPDLPKPLPAQQLGKLLLAKQWSSRKYTVADITGYEQHHDPDGHGFDSNPYAVLLTRDGALVADAAGNDVLRVDKHGHVSVFHVFRNITDTPECAAQYDPTPQFPGCNFVPTSLATDKHGHIYVGALASEQPGAGRVVELDRSGKHVLHVWKGLSTVTGVAIGPDGSVYVSQLEAPEANPPADGVVGVVTKISCSGHRTSVDVPFPAGIAVDKHSNVYVSAWSVATAKGFFGGGPATSGQVWRLRI